MADSQKSTSDSIESGASADVSPLIQDHLSHREDDFVELRKEKFSLESFVYSTYGFEHPRNSDLKSIPETFPAHQEAEEGYLHIEPLQDNESIREKMYKIASERRIYPFRHRSTGSLIEPYRSSLFRFYLCLDAYMKSNNPVMDPEEILRDALLVKGYASTLKKIRFKSFLKTFNLHLLDEDKDLEKIPFYIIKDIGDIFPFQHLPHWEEEVDDTQYYFIPVEIKESTLKEFEEEIFKILPETFERIDPKEILLETSSSTSLDPSLKKGKNYLLKEYRKLNRFSMSPLKGVRSVVQVGPENTRDAVILPVDQLNSIKLIDKNVWKIVEQSIFSAMCPNEDVQARRMNRLGKSNFFLCRDIKKEGISKPRELIMAIKRALSRKYPKDEWIKFLDIYKDFTISIDNRDYKTLRGHGLGMANSLTTLMQIGIFNLTLKRIKDTPDEYIFGKVDMLAYNDDFTAGFEEESDLWTYTEIEEEIMNELSLLRHKNKSFIGNYWVLCEIYSDRDLNKKNSYDLISIYQALACTNIVHAKDYMASLSLSDNKILEDNLREIISYWGYEFSPLEVYYPYSCGGWFNKSLFGISLDLIDIEKYFSKELQRCFEAASTKPRIKSSGREYYHPILQMYEDLHLIPKEIREGLFIHTPVNFVRKKMTRVSLNPQSLKNYYKRLRKIRLNVYRSKKINFVDIDAFKSLYRKKFPYKDFISFSDPFTDEFEKVNYFEEYLYNSDTPLSSLIKYYYPGKIVDDILPNPLGIRVFLEGYQFRSFRDIFISENFLTKNLFHLYGIIDLRSIYLKDKNQINRWYLSPLSNVWRCCLALGKSGLPIPKEDHPLLEEKSRIYKRPLTSFEEFLFQSKKIEKKFINLLLEYLYDFKEEDREEILSRFAKKEYLEEEEEEELQVVHEPPPPIEERNEFWSEKDYFLWSNQVCSKEDPGKLDFLKTPLMELFSSINQKEKIDAIQLEKCLKTKERPKRCTWTSEEIYVFVISGGQIDENGLPIPYSGIKSAFDRGPDETGEEGLGLEDFF
jgi:hypothetical protein